MKMQVCDKGKISTNEMVIKRIINVKREIKRSVDLGSVKSSFTFLEISSSFINYTYITNNTIDIIMIATVNPTTASGLNFIPGVSAS